MTTCDGERSLPAPGLTFGGCVPAPGATPATDGACAVTDAWARSGGRMGRPVRRVLSGGVSPVDGHLSRRHVAVPLQRSTRGLGGPRLHPLSDLAPDEVYRAGRVTTTPVVSYTTLSPLPTRTPAVCFLWHCLADHSGWVLPTVLSCGARTFLGAVSRHATVQPTHSHLESTGGVNAPPNRSSPRGAGGATVCSQKPSGEMAS